MRKLRFHLNRIAILAAFLCFMVSHASFASLINVQFVGLDTNLQSAWATGHPFSGAAVIGNDGDYWNAIHDTLGNEEGSVQAHLSDSTGAPTSAVITMYDSGFFTDSDLRSGAPFIDSPYAALMRQYAYSHSTGFIQITNLAPGPYNLYLYSTGERDGQDRVTDVQVYNLDGSYDLQSSVGPNNFADSLVEGVNYLHFQPTVVDDGALTIRFWGTVADLSGTEGDINGFQLSYAPEPTALWIIGSLPVAALLRRRPKYSTGARNR